MKKARPIIFSELMILALLAGRKTMTRRLVKGTALAWLGKEYEFTPEFVADPGNHLCPHGDVGDLLWVKETHYVWGNWKEDGVTETGKPSWIFVPIEDPDHPVLYCDNKPSYLSIKKRKWGNPVGYYKRPSIFLERKNARIFLQLESIRIEKLQNISEEDAVMEGVEKYEDGKCWLNYMDQRSGVTQFIFNCRTALDSFKSLWYVIHNKHWRDVDDWVWVEGFKVIPEFMFLTLENGSPFIGLDLSSEESKTVKNMCDPGGFNHPVNCGG